MNSGRVFNLKILKSKTMMVNTFHINKKNTIWYFALVPFLFPKGFSEYYYGYKKFGVFILGISIVIILTRELFIVSSSNWMIKLYVPLVLILLYHITLLLITLAKQGTITEGLQKIFAVPAICLLLTEGGRRKLFNIIDVICNILIVEFLLNLLVFNQWLFPTYFLVDRHITFIGHVQVSSEIGILGILIAYAELGYHVYKVKPIVLIMLSFITMIYSKTAASYVSIALIVVFLLLGNLLLVKSFIVKHIKLITVIIIALTAMWLNIDNIPAFSRFHSSIVRYTSGRPFIWDKGIELFKEKPFLGYGAYGALIKPFWVQHTNGGKGFNYAHNTILQLLLDGGIVLTIIFIITLFVYLYHVEKYINDRNTKYIIYMLFITFLFVGQFESITEYYYFFIFLSIIPYMELNCKKKREEYEYYQDMAA